MPGVWKLCDLAEDYLDALKGEGIAVTSQQVLDIQALALDASGNFTDGTRLLPAPAVVGGTTLWPLTIAASMWRDDVESFLDEDDYTTRLFVLAFAMAHGHDKQALEVRGRDALRAIRKWSRSLTCSTPELLAAINSLIDDKPRVTIPDDDEHDDGVSTPEFLARTAIAIFGTDPDIWLYQLSVRSVLEIICRHQALEAAKPGSGLSRRKTEALRKLAYYVDQVRKASHATD